MKNSIRGTGLIIAAGLALACGVVNAAGSKATLSRHTVGMTTYLVEYDEPGVMQYRGGINGLRATAPAGDRPQFNPRSPDVDAYRQTLAQFQAGHRIAITEALRRSPEFTHSYQFTHSGVALQMTAAEAALVRRLPGIKSVKAGVDEHLHTYRGPTFIGAPTIWNAPTPGTAVNRGKGVVIGVLDSGVNSAHPSFADDASCGFGVADHKLLSAVDCASSSAGVCNGPAPEASTSSHGVHTASTAGGNAVTNSAVPSPMLPSPFNQISGVAPCASVRTYRVCPGTTCPQADIVAGINNAIADGVDVINFSISGGTSPWTDNDRVFLEAMNADILVAASAGNTSATVTNPVGAVNHRSPWLVSVAASTHDKQLGPGLSVTAPTPVPAALLNLIVTPGSNTPTPVTFTNQPLRFNAANPTGCTATGGFPAGFFTGSIAIVPRGACNFTEKVANAQTAGASQIVIFNNAVGSLNMNTDGQTLPSYSMSQVQGEALRDYIVANGATATTGTLVATAAADQQGDVLASFSLRGPIAGNLADFTKPDVTAPGVNILAAVTATENNYGLNSGTSMSSPHVAGAAALVRAIRPTWTPMEVKSAMMMTAFNGGFKENGTTAWDADDVGSGRVDLTKATDAGLLMNESYANMLAANPSGGTIDIKALNIPTVRNTVCNGSCTWTRTVRSPLAASATWNVAVQQPTGFTLTVTPGTFTIAAGGTQTLTITAVPNSGEPGTALRFGAFTLTPTVASVSPPLRVTAVVKGAVLDPIFGNGFEGASSGGLACLSVNNRTANAEGFFTGDPANSTVSLNIGVGNQMLGAAADASIEAFDPSWLSETQVTFSSSDPADPNAINLTMSATDESGVETNTTTDGVLLFADFGLSNIAVGADGILHLEWNEAFDDDTVSPDSKWTTPTTSVTCPGIRIICSNQAACDAAVNAATR